MMNRRPASSENIRVIFVPISILNLITSSNLVQNLCCDRLCDEIYFLSLCISHYLVDTCFIHLSIYALLHDAVFLTNKNIISVEGNQKWAEL